jgi:hypothetical protein
MDQETQQTKLLARSRDAELTTYDVWLQYFSIGGNIKFFEVDAYLRGLYPLPPAERDLIAMALNELIDDLPQRPRAAFIRLVLRNEGFQEQLESRIWARSLIQLEQRPTPENWDDDENRAAHAPFSQIVLETVQSN